LPKWNLSKKNSLVETRLKGLWLRRVGLPTFRQRLWIIRTSDTWASCKETKINNEHLYNWKSRSIRAVARAHIGKEVLFQISVLKEEIRQAEHEYMNIPRPSPTPHRHTPLATVPAFNCKIELNERPSCHQTCLTQRNKYITRNIDKSFI
jgi:hypothetical protein